MNLIKSCYPRKSSAYDDHAIIRRVIVSQKTSCNSIRLTLTAKDTNLNCRTIARSLTAYFGLLSYKTTRNTRITPDGKKKPLIFAIQYQKWSV